MIRAKVEGLIPLNLRIYQKKFVEFVNNIEGPKRVIVLKPRQAGFSTLVASMFFHRMATSYNYRAIVMADKKKRTQAVRDIYSTYLQNLPVAMMPMIAKDNTDEMIFDNPSEILRRDNPGFGSGAVFETANDPSAGRSSARKAAHLSEAAFFRYAEEIDESVQNSISLDDDTMIVKESTANGKAGIGAPFYKLWAAAELGESIYRPFFVAWYEVDDYKILTPKEFRLTDDEKEALDMVPLLTTDQLTWRRLKLLEYLTDPEENFLTPEERFKQDFPLTPEQAFRSTGSPVFPMNIISKIIDKLTKFTPPQLQDRIEIKATILSQYRHHFKMYSPARKGTQYFIGADVAEGLANGDSSSVFVLDENMNQVASWHGKIDPDLFGHLLVDIAKIFNDAFIIPEKNNMGHTTVTTIRNSGYSKIYKEVIEDKVTKERSTKYGWTTTSKSKMAMLNETVKVVRDESVNIMDVSLARELSSIARGDNGGVELNSKDRVVALCLAVIGHKQYYVAKTEKNYKSSDRYDLGPKKQLKDMYD